jgi:hypothetical protein
VRRWPPARNGPRRGSQLHITDDPSQRREPFKNRRVGSPRGGMFVAVGWPGFRERGSLGLQIDRRVAMGRIRARMTQPVIDRHEIDASFQEMDRCAVRLGHVMRARSCRWRIATRAAKTPERTRHCRDSAPRNPCVARRHFADGKRAWRHSVDISPRWVLGSCQRRARVMPQSASDTALDSGVASDTP